MILLQQKFIVENVIKAIAPYYKSTTEIQFFIEQLVELAYDFDVVEFKYTYKSPPYTYKKGVLIFQNNAIVANENDNLNTIITSTKKLRNMIIN
jgi:hypothetical protein